jgi:tripartite-type tricarboxylate transporter receptor subunit TctC
VIAATVRRSLALRLQQPVAIVATSVRAAALLIAAACTTSAQTWPSRQVTILVPFPAGGTADLLARDAAQALSEELGQQFIVENRTGAGGNLAGSAVASAAPDGYTILFASQAQAALNKVMFKNPPYDPVRDLVPVVLVAKSPIAVAAGRDAPVRSFRGLIDYAKARPGMLTIGHAGIGSMAHMSVELIQLKTGIKLNSVPYRGGPPLMTDLLGGHVQLASDLLSNFVGPSKEGKIRLLAVTSARRMGDLPDVPTVAEEIGSGFEATAWFAIMVPTGTPADVIASINRIANRYLQSRKGQDLIGRGAMEAGGGTPSDVAAFIKAELEKWEPVISAGNFSLN